MCVCVCVRVCVRVYVCVCRLYIDSLDRFELVMIPHQHNIAEKLSWTVCPSNQKAQQLNLSEIL